MSEALALADRHELRAAVLDLNLNGELATEVLSVLLEDSVPVVVLSGYTDTAKEPPYSRCAFLQKPYAGEDVLRMLEAAIEHGSVRGAGTPPQPRPMR